MEVVIKFEEFELEQQQQLFVINETDVKFETYKHEPDEILFKNEDFGIKSEENGKESLESSQHLKEENKSYTQEETKNGKPTETASLTTSDTSQEWVCCFCEFASNCKNDLREHITAVHKDPANPNLFKCDRCDYNTEYLHKLTSHVTYHRNMEEIQRKLPRPPSVDPRPETFCEESEQKCRICDFTYTNQKEVQEHIISQHKDSSDTNMFKCNGCGFVTQYFHKLARHGSGYSKPSSPYNCEKCSYVTPRWNCFRHHITEHEEKQYKCDKCPFETTARDFLEQHSATHASAVEIPWRRCRMCEYKTTSKYRLSLHELDHDSPDLKAYKCGACKFRTSGKFYLRRHMRRHVKDSS